MEALFEIKGFAFSVEFFLKSSLINVINTFLSEKRKGKKKKIIIKEKENEA